MTIRMLLLPVLFLVVFASVRAELDADELMKQSHLALYYAGDDGRTDVTMTIVNKRGKERLREFTMLRLDNEEGGDQKYYTYFRKPSDVSRLTFMVHKSAEANDKRWIYVPSVDLVRPISADDKASSFVNSHFTYEDVSGRHWSEDNHAIVGDSTVDGVPVVVVESTPVEDLSSFTTRRTYIDTSTYLPLREHYYDGDGTLIRVFTAETIETVSDIPTITVRKIEDVQKGGHTIVAFTGIEYNLGIGDDIFTERYLKAPPREYIGR